MVRVVRPARLAGPFVFLAGVLALVLGFTENQATLSLFVIFPVVTATGPWSILGIVLMIVGVFLFFFTRSPVGEQGAAEGPTAPPAQPSPSVPATGTRRWGGVVFLGPIPVVFGSDQKVARWMLLLGAALFVGLVVLTVMAWWGI